MSTQLTESQLEQVKAAIQAGNKLEAIRIFRDATGKSLPEAKQYVEKLFVQSDDGAIKRNEEFDTGLDKEILEKISDAIVAGKQIEAIKIYRNASGKNLNDAKKFITHMSSRLRESGQKLQPNSEHRFEHENRGCFSGPVTILFLAGVFYQLLR